MVEVKKGEFVELKYTGHTNGEMFDSNIEEDLKKIDSKDAPRKLIVKVGERMVVHGLDDALVGKEIGKKYEITLSAKEGFGERKKELIKTIPLKVFTERKVYPQPGMMLNLDDNLVRISAVSGARVVADFNNLLAGKILNYSFIVKRIVDSDEEKARALFEWLLRFVPEFSIAGDKVVIKGPKILEQIAKAFSKKFKEMMGKELGFELKELPKENSEEKK